MSIPNCTSWRGHNFEGRYSEALPGALESESITVRVIMALKNKTYERDICTRCGVTVEKQTTTKGR